LDDTQAQFLSLLISIHGNVFDMTHQAVLVYKLAFHKDCASSYHLIPLVVRDGNGEVWKKRKREELEQVVDVTLDLHS
jgi:hypothetical protein